MRKVLIRSLGCTATVAVPTFIMYVRWVVVTVFKARTLQGGRQTRDLECCWEMVSELPTELVYLSVHEESFSLVYVDIPQAI